MNFAVNASEMKKIDDYTIQTIGIPSFVLMERAAEKVAAKVVKSCSKSELIGVVCGTGNNGGDGIAVARILYLLGYRVDILLPFDMSRMTEETSKQLEISKKLEMSIRTNFTCCEYNIIIDAIFGIGLHRDVTGTFAKVIEDINTSKAKIIAVDIPSGINASNGKVMSVAVKADMTVTFGEMKLGLLLYPGAAYGGEIFVEDIGFPGKAIKNAAPRYVYYDKSDLMKIPKREEYSNKGTFGKVLVIAGSENMTGAAYFSAFSAYRMGSGLVKVISSKAGMNVIRNNLPEALYASYEGEDGEKTILDSLKWADVVVVGPGLSMSVSAEKIVNLVVEHAKIPVIIDADGIGVLARHLDEEENLDSKSRIKALASRLKKGTILTPHLKELAGLLCMKTQETVSDFIDIPELCTYNNELIYVLKDARTIVAHGNMRYINVSGNHGMATGGSGDVLTGIIAGLIAMGLENAKAAALGVYIHGCAGDIAAKKEGHYSMLASDIVKALAEVMKEYEGRSIL